MLLVYFISSAGSATRGYRLCVLWEELVNASLSARGAGSKQLGLFVRRIKYIEVSALRVNLLAICGRSY